MELVKERELPYASTDVSTEKTEVDIRKLLSKYNINDRQVTEFQGRTYLKFMFKNIPYMIEIPEVQCLKYVGGRWTPGIADKRISMRMMFYYLKSVLEHSTFIDVEQLLLSFRMVTVKGELTTVGKAIEENETLLLGEGESIF